MASAGWSVRVRWLLGGLLLGAAVAFGWLSWLPGGGPAQAAPAAPPDDPRLEGGRRHLPPSQRLSPRPSLRRRAGPRRGLHGDCPLLLPRHALPHPEPGFPLRRGPLPEAEPVPGRRGGRHRRRGGE